MSELPLSQQQPSMSGGEVGMAVSLPTTKAERQKRWIPNSEILGPDALELPPALDDIGDDVGDDTSKRLRTLDEILDDLMTLIMPQAWHIGKLLSGLRWLDQLDANLPPPSPQDHSIYLVTAPRGSTKYRFTHWSLYSQGCFYHLTAASSDALHYMEAKSGKTPHSQLNQKIPIALKLQNVLTPDDVDFVPSTEKTRQIALQAYHIGYTRFTFEQIRRLATHVISELESYNVFDENCQRFALSLATRTVMAQRNCSVFVGDMHQIAAWDSTGGSGSQRLNFSKSTGYVLADARNDPAKRRTTGEMAKMSWRSRRLNRKAEAIAILYRDGDGALGAFDPSGKREGIRYIMYRFHHGYRFHHELATSTAEICEDLKQRRWRDAVFGRVEWRKSTYTRKVAKALSGGKWTDLLLPLYRWSLWITPEERLAWEAEAAGVSSRPREDVAAG